MNKVYRTISIVILIINYCLALSLSDNNCLFSNLASKTIPADRDSYYLSNAKLNLLSSAIKNEKLVNNPNRLPNTSEEKQYQASLDNNQVRESFFKIVFSNYKSRKEFSFACFSSTQIIYPFHYFW